MAWPICKYPLGSGGNLVWILPLYLFDSKSESIISFQVPGSAISIICESTDSEICGGESTPLVVWLTG